MSHICEVNTLDEALHCGFLCWEFKRVYLSVVVGDSDGCHKIDFKGFVLFCEANVCVTISLHQKKIVKILVLPLRRGFQGLILAAVNTNE